MVCLRADESLGMLTPTIVHGARPFLAWSLVLRSNPIVINHWVRLNPVRNPVTQDVVSAPATTTLSMTTRSKMRQRGARTEKIPTETVFAPSRKPVDIITNDPANLYTYAATFTLPGAGRGLFSMRIIGPDSPIDDGEYIGEYIGEYM